MKLLKEVGSLLVINVAEEVESLQYKNVHITYI